MSVHIGTRNNTDMFLDSRRVSEVYIGTRKAFISGGLPEFTYTGEYEIVEDAGGNWCIKFKTSGTLTITKFKNPGNLIDLCLIGGGGGGGGGVSNWVQSEGRSLYAGGGGGAGGCRNQQTALQIPSFPVSITVTVGNGGVGGAGGSTSGGANANPGDGGKVTSVVVGENTYNAAGGAGGSGAYFRWTGESYPTPGGGGTGVSGGGSGGAGNYSSGGAGGSTDILFGDDSYGSISNGGNGGRGGGNAGASGSAGVVYMRNSR